MISQELAGSSEVETLNVGRVWSIGHRLMPILFSTWIVSRKSKQLRKGLWTRKGVHATVVTASHCMLAERMHAELTSGLALASCYSCCVHSWVDAN